LSAAGFAPAGAAGAASGFGSGRLEPSVFQIDEQVGALLRILDAAKVIAVPEM